MKLSLIFLLIVIIYGVFCKHPVLLVPGDGGSQLTALFLKTPPHYLCGRQNKWFNLWLNPFFMLPLSLECFVEAIKLEYNSTSHQTYSPDFCDVQVPGFGSLETIAYLSNVKIRKTSYFYYIINDLIENQGYVPGVNLRGAPYDFRKSPKLMDHLKRDMQGLIENMYIENRNSPLILIGHSLGTLYLNMILNSMEQQWKDKHIKTFISISGPYLGAIDALRTALSGNNEHIPIINPIRVRKAQSSWPSTYYLMPIPGLWLNQTIVATKKGYYTTNTIIQLLKDSGIPNAVEHYKDTLDIQNKSKPPRTSVYCIYSNDVLTTPEVLDYQLVDFPDDQPRIIPGKGDGTVNLLSLQACSNWNQTQTEPVTTFIVPNVTHLEILRDERTIKYLRTIIEHINNNNES